MAVLLGIIFIVCAFVALAACLTAFIGSCLWLRWRVALVPYFRLSEKMKVWYKREQQKDWCTRCGQRLVFGFTFLVVQLPLYFTVAQDDWPVRSITLAIAGVLFVRGVWGHWLGGDTRKRLRIGTSSREAHDAFADVTPTTGARAREFLMDIFTAERVVRLGAYTLFVVVFFGALAWDGGASSALQGVVLRLG